MGDSSFNGRHAVVTGAGQGIGEAIARRLAADGVRLSLMGRRREPLDALASALGGGAAAVTCDVADAASVRDAFAAAQARHGPVEILVNNAGQAVSAPFAKTSEAQWQQMLQVNLTGVFLCTQAAVQQMLQRAGWGRVINIASTAGQRGYAYVSAYCAAKHGVIGLTRALAIELATKGITVNAVCPGYTQTPLLEASVDNVVAKTGRSVEATLQEFASANPQRRLVQPMEVAEAVAWLCSHHAAAVNGQSISVSGGEVM